MGYITKYGDFWGLTPYTAGRLFWVAPAASYTVEGRTYSASDANDGLSPERALLTLDYAVGLTTANVGDTIVLLPGAHSYAATVAVDVAGITITGLPGSPPMHGSRMPGGFKRPLTSIVNTATAGIILTVSVDDVEISWINFLPVAAGGRGIYLAPGADRTYIHDCALSMIATAATSTYGIALGTLATGTNIHTVIRNCYFESGLTAANGAAVVMIGTAYGLSIEHSTFENTGTGAWARVIEAVTASVSAGVTVRDCDFLTSASTTTLMTNIVYSSGAQIDGFLAMLRCYIPAGSDLATGAAIPEFVFAETYISSSLVAGQIIQGNP